MGGLRYIRVLLLIDIKLCEVKGNYHSDHNSGACVTTTVALCLMLKSP